MRPTRKGLLAISVTTTLWGILSIQLKVVSHFIDAYSLVWVRFLIAVLCVLPYYVLRERSKLLLFVRPPKVLWLAGLFMMLNYFGYMRGVELTTPSNATVLGQSGCVMLVLLGFVFLKEKISWQQLIGMIVCAFGFALFFEDQASGMWLNPNIYTQGALWIFIGSFAWALLALISKILVQRYDSQLLNAFMYCCGIMLFIPFVDFSVFARLTPVQCLLVFTLGLNTLFSYGGLVYALKHLNASTVGTITTLSPVICVLLMSLMSYLQIHWVEPEHIRPFGYIGASLTLVGVLIVVKYQKTQKKLPEEVLEVINDESVEMKKVS